MPMTAKEIEANRKRYKAKELRYKHPIVDELNIDSILENLWEMEEACSELKWYTDSEDGEDSLLNAMDGDWDEAEAFKIAFSDLDAELQHFHSDFDDWREVIETCFDIFFVGIKAGRITHGGYLGYDNFEGDYYGLTGLSIELAEEVGAEKVLRMTKKEILEAAGMCFTVAMNYISLKSRYDNLKAAIDILRDKNTALLNEARAIEEAYEKAAAVDFRAWDDATRNFDRLIENLPDRAWIE